MQVLKVRFSQPDCLSRGWLLDGFPHTKAEAAALKAAGLQIDKTVLFESDRKLLIERTKHRRVDIATNKVI